jgi:uncharacterized protein (UPF0548 family)
LINSPRFASQNGMPRSRRQAIAYGTLAEHAESGEEPFTVEWDRSEDNVWYSILAFSLPHKTLARLGYPMSRMLQKRFAEASKAAMVAETSRERKGFQVSLGG